MLRSLHRRSHGGPCRPVLHVHPALLTPVYGLRLRISPVRLLVELRLRGVLTMNAKEYALSLLLCRAAREHLGLKDGENWPADVADAQASAVLAAGYVIPAKAHVCLFPGCDERVEWQYCMPHYIDRVQRSYP